MESICTQTLVIFVIRTRVVPFYTSRPSRLLTFSTILIVAIACILPFTVIMGPTRIGANCRIGPFAYIQGGTTLADGTEVSGFRELGP